MQPLNNTQEILCDLKSHYHNVSIKFFLKSKSVDIIKNLFIYHVIIYLLITI